jgi:uncharacterized protein
MKMAGTIEDDSELRSILRQYKVVAVVGLSDKLERPSYQIAQYLKEHGYTIIPVNPGLRAVLGEKCYSDLPSIPVKVDIVDVFRQQEQTPPIAEAAVAIGAKVLWLQKGIVNPEAAKIAADGGLRVVMDHCMREEHSRLLSEKIIRSGDG